MQRLLGKRVGEETCIFEESEYDWAQVANVLLGHLPADDLLMGVDALLSRTLLALLLSFVNGQALLLFLLHSVDFCLLRLG